MEISDSTVEVIKRTIGFLNSGDQIDNSSFINENKSAVFEIIRTLIEKDAKTELRLFCNVLGIVEITQ